MFVAMVHELRDLLSIAYAGIAQSTTVNLNSQTLQSTPERGGYGGSDGTKRKQKVKLILLAMIWDIC